MCGYAGCNGCGACGKRFPLEYKKSSEFCIKCGEPSNHEVVLRKCEKCGFPIPITPGFALNAAGLKNEE